MTFSCSSRTVDTSAVRRSLEVMRVLAGLFGVVVGFLLGGILIDVIFPDDNWPNVLPFVLAVAGGFAGTMLATHWRPR